MEPSELWTHKIELGRGEMFIAVGKGKYQLLNRYRSVSVQIDTDGQSVLLFELEDSVPRGIYPRKNSKKTAKKAKKEPKGRGKKAKRGKK